MSTNILLTSTPATREDLEQYRGIGGYGGLQKALTTQTPSQVVDEIEAAQLRGRGGASFPVHRKWRIALGQTDARPARARSTSAESSGTESSGAESTGPESTSTVKYVIANGGEHEPGSNKDRYLLQYYPHKVLEGLLLCGFATGASKGYMYLIEDMTEQIDSVAEAMREMRSENLLGSSILGTDFSFEIEIHRAPTTYVAGEETAAIDSIEGGEGKPRAKPPYPGESGLFQRPTTVNNVETLAHAAWIVRHGADAFARIGTQESKGTMLFTLDDAVEKPGVYERPFGVTYRELIFEDGGGPRQGRAIRGILPALSCGFLSADSLDTPIAYETLKELGSSPGCGGVHLILEGDEVIHKVLSIAKFFMKEQCGQCAACRMETNQFVHILEGVASGKKGDFEGHLQKLASFARGKGHCSLIEMAAAPVLSAAKLFHDDFEACAKD